MSRVCPKPGHIVAWMQGKYKGLIVNKRGIEVRVMVSNHELVWIRRDQLEVICVS